MSENVEKINWGWLNDFNGYKFAPITFIEKIYNEQGQPFIAQFNSIKTDYDALLAGDKIIKEAVSASNLINNGIPYNVGNEGNPVYFESGVPKACTELTNNKISTNEFECGGLSNVGSLLVRTDATIGESLRINPNNNNTSPGLIVNYIRGEKLKKDGTVAQEDETAETERIIKLHGNLSLEPRESMIKFYHLWNEDSLG